MFELTTYQDKAADKLLRESKELLQYGGNKKLVFKAPTGSGKTITMAEFLTRFSDDKEHTLCAFIWTAPRQLHKQSKEKVEAYFTNSRAMECSFFEDLDDRQIGENEILFFNWESIRQEGNIYISGNEQGNNLSNVLERTRDAGLKVILIIDESHYHAQAETSQGLIKLISPELTIEVSATPVVQNPDRIVSVEIEDVKKEEMIKKAVVLNEDFKNMIKRGGRETIKSELAGSTDEIVLRVALKKRMETVRAYKAEKISVNPLLLIQLPDRRGQSDEDRQEILVRILKGEHDISIENGKLAIYLSEDKKNLENITRNDSEVEVLIFKQAIALGWDCPRAQVLVLFREWSSPIFSIQTIGRIMRVPEPERGWYETNTLNYAYVYTNIDDIEIEEDMGKGYIVIHESKRIKNHKLTPLPSVHRERHREHTRLRPVFRDIFLERAIETGLEKKINVKNQRVYPAFISDWETKNVDTVAGTHIKADIHLDTENELDLQRLFEHFARKSLAPLYPEQRSVDRIRESIYRFFSKRLGMEKREHFKEIINITLSEENKPHFESVIELAKVAYRAETESREKVLVEQSWDIPARILYGKGVEEREGTKKSVMQPYFSDERWDSEKRFVEFLEHPRNQVWWWFKNGGRDATGTYLSVPYGPLNDRAPFYVDYVVMMKDGSIGLLDPHGIHLADFAVKSDGLHEYIDRLRKDGRKIFGGIIANTKRDYTGQWMLYEGEGAKAKKDDWTGWTPLELQPS